MPRTETPPRRRAGISLVANFLVSWTLLPFALPPFRAYSLSELFDVLLWQGMGAVGWPSGLVGGLANLVLNRKLSDLVSLLWLLIYPMMSLLLISALSPKRSRLWVLVLLHLLLPGSFAVLWRKILDGYDFMKG